VANIHDRAEAVKALIATGPAAEKMVMQGVATTSDDGVATELIKVLGEIGTKNCVPLLTRATKSKNPFLARTALLALKHVSERAGDAGK
jgi:HEAT repeat protein